MLPVTSGEKKGIMKQGFYKVPYFPKFTGCIDETDFAN